MRSAQVPAASPLPLWWSRDFPGEPSAIRQARSWVAGLLPACAPLDDLLIFASELATNAAMHTRSGEPGGHFTVEVIWSAESARVVVGDQGSDAVPVSSPSSGAEDVYLETGRGLRLIDSLSAAWGFTGDADARWLWADVHWRSGDGSLPAAGISGNITEAQFLAALCVYPGTQAWYSEQSGEWCATLPDGRDACDILSAPSPTALIRMLASRYPVARTDTPGDPQPMMTALVAPAVTGLQRAHR